MADASDRPSRGSCGAAALVAGIAFATYAAALGFDFVYDDDWTIVRNKYMEWPLAQVLRASFTGAARALSIPDGTRPLMILSNWVDRRIFGLAPEGHHLHSLLWYAACSVAALFASFALTQNRRIALFATLFFAVAPVHAEVAAAINYREDLLSSFAVLVAVAWLFWPRRRETIDGAVVSAGVLGLGLLGKESAIAIVAITAALVVVSPRLRRRLRFRKASLSCLGVVLLVWGVWRAWLRLTGRDDVPLAREARSLGERLLRTCRYEVQAVRDSVWPTAWAPDHPAEAAAEWWWAVLFVAVLGVAWAASRHRKTQMIAIGLAWTLAAPLATSPLLSPINERTDRYLFLSVLGAGWVWGDVLHRWLKGVTVAATPEKMRSWAPRALQLAALALLVLLAAESRRAVAPWSTNASLWRAAVDREPGSARAWTGLSGQLRVEGKLDDADLAVERAIKLEPRFLRARVTRLYNTLARGDVNAARQRILEIEAMGGADQLGMRRARHCADLEPGEARTCARRGPTQSPETRGSGGGVNPAPDRRN